MIFIVLIVPEEKPAIQKKLVNALSLMQKKME